MSFESENEFAGRREQMVAQQLRGRDIVDERVLAAMQRVPRHEFVDSHLRTMAYEDRPLSIGHQQTISQPYIVALMSQLARVEPDDMVLDVGTGSGYQAAVLAELATFVESVEIVEPLAVAAAARLKRLGYENVRVRHSDALTDDTGAEFNVIVAAAAPADLPQALVARLAPGGRLVMPIGTHSQTLVVVERTASGLERASCGPVAFVPMTGAAADSLTNENETKHD